MAKCVLKNAEIKNILFLGTSEPQIRGPEGVLEATKTACNSTLNFPDAFRRIFEATSSFAKDGT